MEEIRRMFRLLAARFVKGARRPLALVGALTPACGRRGGRAHFALVARRNPLRTLGRKY